MRKTVKEKLSEDFFHGRSVGIAKELLGKLLVNEENGTAGRIVETEAYLGRYDPSCHFAKSGEARKKIFRKGAGTVYVYVIHGHNCMNFISEYQGEPEGILIRAVEPVRGIDRMIENRGKEEKTELGSGPGKLTEALGIEKEKHNGQKIEESPITVYGTGREVEVETSRRIGIKEAEDWPCRFLARNSDFVSKPAREPSEDHILEKVYQSFG